MARGVRLPASLVSDALDTPEDNPDGIHPSLDERCPLTELLVDECAHCRKLPDAEVDDDPFDDPAPPRRAGQAASWFRAAYPGACSSCGDGFDEGDVIRADGEGGYEMRDCTGCDR